MRRTGQPAVCVEGKTTLKDDDNWIAHFPGLTALSPDLRQEFISRSRIISLPAGSRIFGPGQAPQNFLLLVEGTLRVQQVSPGGREIVLYRVSAGESCALTTACLMSYGDYLAEAIAETDIRAVAIPRAAFDDLIARSPEFRRFVFTAYSQRVTNLFHVIDDIVFARLDIRLAQRILALAGSGDHLTVTQQQLAAELGTAREVISRLLGEFQRRGWLTVMRGGLTLINREALCQLAKEG
jgi:CRP/FNR family transcriptional regulator